MKKIVTLIVMLSTMLVISPKWSFADNPPIDTNTPQWLLNLCTEIHCLDNITAKMGYDFREKEYTYGGYTELYTIKQYVGLAPGIEKSFGADVPFNFDANVVLHLGTALANSFETIQRITQWPPLAGGLLKYSTLGYSAYWDFRLKEIRHGPWFGLQAKFQ